jgi:regulator of sirC expression with transglutaminase-like and TPR domain
MNARQAFAEMAGRPSEAIEIDRAALLIAAEEYPELRVETYLAQLDGLAERVSQLLYADAGSHEILARLHQILFEEEGFHGNLEDYYDPRNSYLNQVLDRRTGIPITISTVYLEVARRLGFRVVGVGFPGHFLVKHSTPRGSEIVIDPFAKGKILSLEECRERLSQMSNGQIEFTPEHLRPATARQMLVRMLNNLKTIYLTRDDDRRALAAVERILLLAPELASEIRDKGMLLARLDRPLEALAALARYRELSPEASDATRVDELMDRLRLKVGTCN